MNLNYQQIGAITLVSLSGQVDSVTAVDLETQLMEVIEKGAYSILLDFTHLDYINSAGLRVFLLAGKRLEQVGGTLAFCNLSANVHMIFETIGFDRILTLYPDRASALEGMNLASSKAA